ncbi:TPA: hypothetical protein JLE37_000423 [Escherichia coli]|nr:hypothetical protein [Escherichia coli]
MKITPEQAREALDAWICRPGMTQEQATILITEAFWALKERPNIDVQRVTYEGGAVDQRALSVNRVKIFERWKAIDTRDKREKFTALVPAIMEATPSVICGGEAMKSMDKLTTGIAYSTSAGSAGYWFLQLLDKVTPSQWAAIGVLGSLVFGMLTYLTNLYFKIKEDRRKVARRE